MASARLASQDHHNRTGGIDGGLTSPGDSGVPKKVACDRCRGQKLRCVWDPRAPRCRRCERAKTVCAVLPPRPMGRPCAQQKNSQHNPNPPHQQSQEHHPRSGKSQTEAVSSVSHYPAGIDIGSADMEMQDGIAEMVDGILHRDSSGHDNLEDLPIDPLLGDDLSPHSFLMQLSQTNLRTFDTNSLFGHSPMLQNASGSDGPFGSFNPFLTPFHDDPATHDGTPFRTTASDYEGQKAERPADGHLVTIEQLSRLNLILYKHIANMPTAHDNTRSSPAIPAPPDDPSILTSKSPPSMNLHLGHLLSMTQEFRTLTDQLGVQFPGTSLADTPISGPPANRRGNTDGKILAPGAPFDHSTALLLLSCYMRLKQAHGRALQILHQLLERQSLGNPSMPELLPDLVIDGFSLAGHGSLQMGLVVTLCEQMFSSIGHPALDGRSTGDMDWGSFAACLTEKLQELG